MGRTPYCDDKTGFRKGIWTAEEDRKLVEYVTRYGCLNWKQLPKHAGLARCGKSCRLRWVNYLKPNIKRGNFTKEEDHIILNMHQHLGNKWSSIAAKLPGRTDNEIKNHWHTSLKKISKEGPPPPPSRRRRKPSKGSPVESSSSSSTSDGSENSSQNNDRHSPPSTSTARDEISESSGQRPASSGEASSSSSSSFPNSASLTERDGTVADGGSFWTEPFIVESYGNGWSPPSTSRNEFDVGLLSPPFPFLPDCDDDFDHLLLFDSLCW